jgi:hypothetical protein
MERFGWRKALLIEYHYSRTDTLFQSISRHDLGLAPEMQEFLFSFYERHPDLNVAETRMLVRATRLDEETIEFFCKSSLLFYVRLQRGASRLCEQLEVGLCG